MMSKINTPRDGGKGFKVRIEGHDWSGKLLKSKLDEATEIRVKNSHLGEKVVAISLKSGFRWFIRKVEFDPVIQTVGNDDIDKIFDFVFEELKALGPENWGICVRKNISGLYIPSQHNPWEDMNDGKGPGSNAIDIGILSHTRGDQISNAMASSKECPVGKMLYFGRVWERGKGWQYASSIGHSHDTHIHAQGLEERPSRWDLVRSSCP